MTLNLHAANVYTVLARGGLLSCTSIAYWVI